MEQLCKPKFRSSYLYRMMTRASLITTVTEVISQEMGAQGTASTYL